MKTVFVVMSADFFHVGHLNIITVARELGPVTVGLATEEFNARHKRVAVMSYEQRKAIVENIKGVERVIPQESLDLEPNLRELRPDYFVHGDDWQVGPLRKVRQQAIEILREWGGVLVEPPYTEGVSSTKLNLARRSAGATPEGRIHHFRRLLAFQPFIRVLEAHNGLTGLIVEHAQIISDGRAKEFDAIWFGTLTDALSKGKPDIGYLDLTSRLGAIHDILDGTTKPVIVDAGDGGAEEQFVLTVRTLERLGVSAVVIGDRNESAQSARPGVATRRAQGELSSLGRKISAGKRAQVTTDFSIIARISSLTLHPASADALLQAQAGIEAGADAMIVEGPAADGGELQEFRRLFVTLGDRVPLLALLPANSSLQEHQLADTGIRGVIYADLLLRAAYRAMLRTAEDILRSSGVWGVEASYVPLDEIRSLVAGWSDSGSRPQLNREANAG